MYNRLPEDELSNSKHVEDKISFKKISLEKINFVGLYCIIILLYTVQKTYNKIYIMCCCFLNVSLIFPLLQITAQVVTSLEFIFTNALQV